MPCLPIHALPGTLLVASADYLNGGSGVASNHAALASKRVSTLEYKFSHSSIHTDGSVNFSIGIEDEALSVIRDGVTLKFGSEQPVDDQSRRAAIQVDVGFYITVTVDPARGIDDESYAADVAKEIEQKIRTFMAVGKLTIWDFISTTPASLSKDATWYTNGRPTSGSADTARMQGSGLLVARRAAIYRGLAVPE